MDDAVITKVNRSVSKQFPEMRGIRPRVKLEGEDRRGNPRFLLTYSATAELPGGRKMKRVVRAVVDERGKILKLSTSK
jgi:hypothetical protein